MKTYANINFIQKLSKTVWEGTHASKALDFYLSKEDGLYVLQIFNSNIKNCNKAFIETSEFTSFKEAIKYFGEL